MLTLCGCVSIVDEWYMLKFMDDTCWIGIWYHSSAFIWHRVTGVWFYASFLRQCRECWNSAHILILLTCGSRQLYFSMSAHVHVEIDASFTLSLSIVLRLAMFIPAECCKMLQRFQIASSEALLWNRFGQWSGRGWQKGNCRTPHGCFDSYRICCSLPWCWRPIEAIRKPLRSH